MATRLLKSSENINGLPIGFQEVEYLESTGTQYIDTGYNAKSTLKTDIHFEVVDKTQGGHIFGGRTVTSGGRGYGVYLPTSGGIGFDYETRLTSNVSTTNGYKYRVVKNGASNTLYVNGVQSYTGNNTDATFDLNVTMALFYMKDSNTAFNVSVKCKVFYFKIWDNNTLVRDFIPALNPAGRPCMYDLVGKKAYYNLGSGEFTYGRKIIPVEYLESTGTQRIDTGISTAEGICTEAKFKINTITSTSQVVFGKVGSTSSPTSRYWFGAQGSTQKWYYAVNEYITTSANADADIHTVVLDTVNNVCTLDGETIATFSDLNSNSETISLFSVFYQGSLNNPMSGRIYYTKIWNNGTLVRDFIPCIDENNVPYMFNKVTHSCYLNAGTGTFNYGKKLYSSKVRLYKDSGARFGDTLPKGFKRVEYLESSGTQYINTGINANSNPKYEINFGISYTNPSSPTNQYTGADYGGTYGVVSGNFQWSSVPVVANKYYEIRFVNENGIRNGYVDGVAYAGSTYQSNGYRVLLFAAGENANGTSYSTPFSCKLYYFKVFLGGVLVGDFIPALDTTNTPCMYDTVTQTAFYNQGTGQFTYGSIIPNKVRLPQSTEIRFPKGYTEVEYLESTGTQYIDTGVIPTNTHGISINFSFSSNESFDGSWCPIGARTGDIRFWINKSVELSGLTFGFGDFTPSRQAQPKNTLLKASLNLYNNRKMIYVNGNYQENITSSISNLSNTLYLFGANVNGSVSFVPPDCRIYTTQITEGSAIVRNFIPCLDPNGKPCMWDVVTKQPFYNQGTGEFTYGRSIQQVSYLESTGTQYIDTGYAANANTIVEYNFNLVEVPTSSAFFGSGTSSTSTDRFQGYYESSLSFSTKLASTTTYSGVTLTAGTKHYSKMGIPLAGYYIDNTFIASATGAPTSLNLYVFARNINGSMQVPIKMKLYDFKISENNSLARDYTPAIDSNNVGFMFDRVTHTIFDNAGTGSFTYGNTVPNIIRN